MRQRADLVFSDTVPGVGPLPVDMSHFLLESQNFFMWNTGRIFDWTGDFCHMVRQILHFDIVHSLLNILSRRIWPSLDTILKSDLPQFPTKIYVGISNRLFFEFEMPSYKKVWVKYIIVEVMVNTITGVSTFTPLNESRTYSNSILNIELQHRQSKQS